jgi:hypothetical protein
MKRRPLSNDETMPKSKREEKAQAQILNLSLVASNVETTSKRGKGTSPNSKGAKGVNPN